MVDVYCRMYFNVLSQTGDELEGKFLCTETVKLYIMRAKWKIGRRKETKKAVLSTPALRTLLCVVLNAQ